VTGVKIRIEPDGSITIECSPDEVDKLDEVLKKISKVRRQAGADNVRIRVSPVAPMPSPAPPPPLPSQLVAVSPARVIARAGSRQATWPGLIQEAVDDLFQELRQSLFPEDIIEELMNLGLRRALVQTLMALMMANSLYGGPVTMEDLRPFLEALGARRDASNNYRYLKELVSMGFVAVERTIFGRSKNSYEVNYERLPSSVAERVKELVNKLFGKRERRPSRIT